MEKTMAKITPFEENTARYDDWFVKHQDEYESELAAVRKLMPESKSSIEIGVGSGRFAAPLGIRDGVEPSEKMAEMARAKGIRVVPGTAEDIPFPAGRFDLALMVTTICFVDDIPQAMKELYRILKPGGFFLNCFIDKTSPIGKIYQAHKDKSVFYKPAVFVSVDEVVDSMEKAGFQNFTFVQTIFHPLGELSGTEPVKPGYGEGSFVVVRAEKPQ
jgi:ubiquinone/menaquinone biosynthesis C-methylase UbiE